MSIALRLKENSFEFGREIIKFEGHIWLCRNYNHVFTQPFHHVCIRIYFFFAFVSSYMRDSVIINQ